MGREQQFRGISRTGDGTEEGNKLTCSSHQKEVTVTGAQRTG